MEPQSTRVPASTRTGVQQYEQSVVADPTCELEKDLYTDAVISLLRLPVGFDATPARDWAARIIPILAMIAVAGMQLSVTRVVHDHIYHSLLNGRWSILDTAMERLVGANSTMPPWLASEICGQYDQREIVDGPMDKVVMSDGTVFTHGQGRPLWYTVKLASDSWDPRSISPKETSILDEARFVAEEGCFGFALGFSLLFISMAAIWYLTIIVEYRNIMSFAAMLSCISTVEGEDRFALKKDANGKFTVQHLTRSAKAAGVLCVMLRMTIATYLLYCGSLLLVFSTTKMSLIFTSLALGFVLNLDNIVYVAIVSTLKQRFLSDLHPVAFPRPPQLGLSVMRSFEVLMPVLALFFCGAAAFGIRFYQVGIFHTFYNDAAALCLFSGPTPGGRSDVLAPVPGLCETLLSMSCAPVASGPGADRGPCVVTDQGVFREAVPNHQFYADEELFEGMTGADGVPRGFRDWGAPKAELYDDYWTTNLLRKVCLQLWRPGPGSSLDTRVVDTATGQVQQGAPFYCAKAQLFQPIFGSVRPVPQENVGVWSFSVQDLQNPHTSAAIDGCSTVRRLASVRLLRLPGGGARGGRERTRRKRQRQRRLRPAVGRLSA